MIFDAPAMVISELEQARAVLLAAAGQPLYLRSPAGAAGQYGIGWWLALVKALRDEFGPTAFTAVLDCGAAPGHALAALAAGVEAVGLTAEAEVLEHVRHIAAARGARVVNAVAPPSGEEMNRTGAATG